MLAQATPAFPHDLALRMLPAIHRIAHQLARRLPRHIRIDDLVGAGCQGLVAAIARFDPVRGEGFESYAEFRIRGAMLDELRASDPLSRDQRAHANRIAAATRTLQGRLGRAPMADEIAAELGVTLDTYWERHSAAASGVTTTIDGDDEHNPAIQLRDQHAEPADETLGKKQIKQAINAAIAQLPARLQRVLELHYADGLTLKQIGDLLGVSESRVCQIQSEAIRRLREACHEHIAGAQAPANTNKPRRAPRRAAPPPTAMAA